MLLTDIVLGKERLSDCLRASALTTQPFDSSTENGGKLMYLLIHIPENSVDREFLTKLIV